MAAFCSLRAGFLAQNVYRSQFSKAARLNQLYAAFFHNSPILNAGLFGFGGDEDGGSFLDNFYEAHSHMVEVDKSKVIEKATVQLESQEKLFNTEVGEQVKQSRKSEVEEQHRKHIMRGAKDKIVDESATEMVQGETYASSQPEHIVHSTSKKSLKWYEAILMEGHGMAKVKTESRQEMKSSLSPCVKEETEMCSDLSGKERQNGTAKIVSETNISNARALKDHSAEASETYADDQFIALSNSHPVTIDTNLEVAGIPQETEFVHHQPAFEPKSGPKNVAKLDYMDAQRRKAPIDLEDDLISCQKENLQEIGSSGGVILQEELLPLKESSDLHEYPDERKTTLIVPLEAVGPMQPNPIDLSGEHTELQAENLQAFAATVQEQPQSDEHPLQNVDIHEYSSVEQSIKNESQKYEISEGHLQEDTTGDDTINQLVSLTLASKISENVEVDDIILQQSEFVHHQPALEPKFGPKNVARLDYADVQKKKKLNEDEDELTSYQKDLENISTAESKTLQEDESDLKESSILHEYPEERRTTLIVPLEAVEALPSDPIDLSGEHTQLQEENLQVFAASVQESEQSLEDPLQNIDIHDYSLKEADSIIENKPLLEELKGAAPLIGDMKTSGQDEAIASLSPSLTPDSCSQHQVPEDTKDIKVGTLIAVMAPEGEDWKTIEIPALDDAMPQEAAPTDAAAAPAATGTDHDHGNYGPSVRLLLEQYGLTASQVPPGGPHGILVKGDVLKFIKERGLQPQPVPIVPPPKAPKAAVAAAPPPSVTPSVPPPPPTVGVSEDGYEDIEVTSMRRTIAKRLTQSKSGIAHAYGTLQCRSDKLLELRKKYKAEGINVSVNDLIIKAVSVALTKCPEMNCVWQGDQLAYASQVDMSIAVATPTGLITPIVRNADSIGIEEIASKVRDLATRAKENKLKLDEFQGGTFTISNLGMFGISEFSAIINPPQCGILAVGSGIVSIDENGSPITCMRATLSYDRAGVDDDTAAVFLETLKNILENPATMMLGGYKSQVDHPLAALL